MSSVCLRSFAMRHRTVIASPRGRVAEGFGERPLDLRTGRERWRIPMPVEGRPEITLAGAAGCGEDQQTSRHPEKAWTLAGHLAACPSNVMSSRR